jgi:DNA-binding PadR family transcriptional regulator
MSVKYALLGILSERDRHGYDLKGAFDERVGEFWSLNYGQIYTTLDRLEREGLVEWRDEPQEKRPDRKIYRITGKGRRELERWLGRPVARTRALRDELFIKLLFLDRGAPAPILDLIHRQKQVYLQHMKRLTKRKIELGRRPDHAETLVTELLMDAALFHAEADVRWLGLCEQKLAPAGRRRDGTRGGRREEAR